MKVNPYEPVVIQSGPRAAADNSNANRSITHAHVCKVSRIFGVFGLLCPGTWMALLTLIASLSVVLRSLKELDFAYFFYGVCLLATSIAQLLFVICLLAGFFCKRTRAMSICATAMLGTYALWLGILWLKMSTLGPSPGLGHLGEIMAFVSLVSNLLLFGSLRFFIARTSGFMAPECDE